MTMTRRKQVMKVCITDYKATTHLVFDRKTAATLHMEVASVVDNTTRYRVDRLLGVLPSDGTRINVIYEFLTTDMGA